MPSSTFGLRGGIEHRRRVVEDQEHRPLEQRAHQRRLLPVGHGKARAADADLVVEADLHHQRPQAELVEQLAHQRA